MSRTNVWWASLCERNGAATDKCYNAMLDVAMNAGQNGYKRMSLGYSRTDYARNEFVKAFLQESKRDNDLLVMLDGDHQHPANIIERFAAEDPRLGVVGALAFRRGEPFDPLFFIRFNGGLHAPAEFNFGEIYACAIVSTSAISIRRWVLLELEHKGYLQPFFRYEYPVGGLGPSEDMYFGRICEQAGIAHHCDTSIIIPHATSSWVDENVFKAYLESNPTKIQTVSVEAPGE